MQYVQFISKSIVVAFLASALGSGVMAAERDETPQQEVQQQLKKQQEQIAELTRQLEEEKKQHEKDKEPSRGVQAREAIKDAGKKIGKIFK